VCMVCMATSGCRKLLGGSCSLMKPSRQLIKNTTYIRWPSYPPVNLLLHVEPRLECHHFRTPIRTTVVHRSCWSGVADPKLVRGPWEWVVTIPYHVQALPGQRSHALHDCCACAELRWFLFRYPCSSPRYSSLTVNLPAMWCLCSLLTSFCMMQTGDSRLRDATVCAFRSFQAALCLSLTCLGMKALLLQPTATYEHRAVPVCEQACGFWSGVGAARPVVAGCRGGACRSTSRNLMSSGSPPAGIWCLAALKIYDTWPLFAIGMPRHHGALVKNGSRRSRRSRSWHRLAGMRKFLNSCLADHKN